MPMIHNRGRQIGEKTVARTIIFPKDWDAEGAPVRNGKKIITETLKPGAHRKVSDKQLAHLKALFPDEIVNIDDIDDMQAQFKEKAPEKSREGYVAPEEVNALVEKRAQELAALAAARAQDEDNKKAPETREALIKRIDSMDRMELIAYIEAEKLGVEHKSFKAPGTLQAAILAAVENKAAAKEAAE